MLIRTADAIALFNGSPTALARALPAEHRRGKMRRLTRQAVHLWGEFLPPLRARQLIEVRPDATAYIVGEDGLTAVERSMLAAQSAAEQGTRGPVQEEDSHG